MEKEYVVAVKEIYIAYVVVKAEDEKAAIKKVMAGEGKRGDDLDNARVRQRGCLKTAARRPAKVYHRCRRAHFSLYSNDKFFRLVRADKPFFC